MRRSRHLAIVGQHGQKGLHIGHAHVTRVAHTDRLRGTPANKKSESSRCKLFRFCGYSACTEFAREPDQARGGCKEGAPGFMDNRYQNMGLQATTQAACCPINNLIYRLCPDVSTGFFGLHYVGRLHQEVSDDIDSKERPDR